MKKTDIRPLHCFVSSKNFGVDYCSGLMLDLDSNVVADRLVSFSRAFEPTAFGMANFASGRIEVRPEFKGLGLGTKLMDVSLEATKMLVNAGSFPTNLVLFQVEDKSQNDFTRHWAERNAFQPASNWANAWVLHILGDCLRKF